MSELRDELKKLKAELKRYKALERINDRWLTDVFTDGREDTGDSWIGGRVIELNVLFAVWQKEMRDARRGK